MVDLNNIFNKFFPKSQTSPTGKKLIYMAWAIEITVALVGFTIAGSFILIGIEETKELTGEIASSSNIQYMIIGLAFFVVGIMELTKIPLATALYYSVKTYWKIIFLLALLAVNFSTFETILQGFQLAYSKNTKPVEIIRNQLEELKNEKSTKEERLGQEDQIDNQILELREQINQINQQILTNNTEATKKRSELEMQNAIANPRRDSLIKQIDEITERISKLEDEKSKAVLSLQGIQEGFFNKQKNKREAILAQIQSYDNEIDKLEVNKTTLSKQLDQVLSDNASQNIPLINQINQELKLKNDELQKQIDQIQNEQINPKLNAKKNITDQQNTVLVEIDEINQKIDLKAKEVNEKARDNSFYQMAVMIKVGPGQWFFGDVVDKDITPADLTQEDMKKAFWLWFGFLAFIISIIGTLVALAGLHLMDERMHEIRNQPLNRKNTLRYRFGRLFVSLSKYFSTQIKVMIKPKTIEKIIEKEIEVEKIIEKPIYQDRIVHVDREVPKETIVKEIVYVPLPTDDAEVLKKGVFKANEFNEKSKKK